MQANRRKTIKGIAAGIAVLVGGVNPVGAEDGDAKLRAAHAVPDASAVDVLVNGNVAVPDLAFGDVTGYLEVPAGEYDLAINVAGTSTTCSAPRSSRRLRITPRLPSGTSTPGGGGRAGLHRRSLHRQTRRARKW
jgi:hypothetical protein